MCHYRDTIAVADAELAAQQLREARRSIIKLRPRESPLWATSIMDGWLGRQRA